MGLFKKFGEAAPPLGPLVVLGRKHGPDPVVSPIRGAVAYGTAGAAAGAPKIIDFDGQVMVHVYVASVVTVVVRNLGCRTRVL